MTTFTSHVLIACFLICILFVSIFIRKCFFIYLQEPIGILTTSAGKLIEIRESITLNSDAFSNQYHIDLITHADAERIPERLVHAKGTAALGYFEVTNDISQYTKAEVLTVLERKHQL